MNGATQGSAGRTEALGGFQGRGCADGVHPDLCRALFREALIFQ